MKRLKITLIIVAAIFCAFPIGRSYSMANEKKTAIPRGFYFLQVGDDSLISDNAMAIRMTVIINPTKADLGTRLQYRYKSYYSNDSWTGQLKNESQQELLFISQYAPRTASFEEPIVTYTFQHGGSSESNILEASGKNSLDEVVRITIETGFYKIGEPLVIGTLGDEPITLSLETPDKLRNKS